MPHANMSKLLNFQYRPQCDEFIEYTYIEEIWFTEFMLVRKCKFIKNVIFVVFEDLIAAIRLFPASYRFLILCFLP
jgi:hypothetical protein